ncbi:MAG TPA: M56 family metallopeptidase [Verrucomicrobiae bacterium]|nr:M56 family metallopeptidase [Verrucomicrobiae bacterium]
MSAELSSLTPLANHLWQSTLFVGLIWLLTLAFKKNRAAVRYWLWFAASVKFLLPFSFLVALGSRFSWRSGAPVAQPQWSFVVDNAIQPFAASTAPPQVVSPHASFTLTSILIVVWLCGIAVGIGFWLKCWMQMRRVRKTAAPLPLGLPIPVLSSPSQIEPGVFGIFRPVLLLPEGIESRLTPTQLDAIVAHEMAHVRRHDNLTAAIHMLVEIVFWFFPVVYWLRVRLIEERENACDEVVISAGSEAESYAEGIIEVCKSYVESPATCISGISGSDLKWRIARILNRHFGENLTRSKKVALVLASGAALIAPLVIGALNAPLLDAQSTSGDKPKFEVASVKPCEPGSGRGGPGGAPNRLQWSPGRLTVPCQTAWVLIGWAYVRYADGRATPGNVGGGPAENTPIEGLPSWGRSQSFTISAEVPGDASKEMMMGPMMQSLLEKRFKLKLHTENRVVPVYDLTVAKGGLKLPQTNPDAICRNAWDPKTPARKPGDPYDCNAVMPDITISDFATSLPVFVGRPVIDKTGITGRFAIHMAFSRPDMTQSADAPPSIFTALKEQLGLELTPSKGPQPTIVIDHIEEPTPN